MSTNAEVPQLRNPVPTYVWVCLGFSMLAGPVGLAIFGFVCLVRARPPQSMAGQRLRILGLAAGWTATATGAAGGVVGFVLGLDYPPTLAFAVIEGALIGAFAGLLLGALVGPVLVLVHVRRSTSA